MKPTLLENFQEAIVVEKDVRVIGVIVDDESAKDLKDIGRRSHNTVGKAKEKEASEIDNLKHLIKFLKTEISELKQRTSEIVGNIRPPKFTQRKKMTLSSSSATQPNLHRALTLCSNQMPSRQIIIASSIANSIQKRIPRMGTKN